LGQLTVFCGVFGRDEYSETRDTHFSFRPWLRDPSDEFVLEVAFAAGNVPIVTHNVKDFRRAPELGVRVITPTQLAAYLNLP
jgi:predicted nucleic acid-binding protein